MMRKHSLKALLIVFISLGALGLALVIGGSVVNGTASQRHYDKARRLSLYDIAEAYKAFGIGEETLDKIDEFEKTLSEYSAAKNNIVIVDGNGYVVYKLNDDFLHLNANRQMSLACRGRNAVTMDPSNSARHWYLMRDLDGVYSDWLFGYGDMVVIGDIKAPAEDVRNMLNVYDGQSAEANISPYAIRKDGGPEYPYGAYYPDEPYIMATPTSAPSAVDSPSEATYLLWFRDAAMDADISKALGPTYREFYYFATRSGALLLLLYWLLAPVYVFLDARRKKAQPLPWALLVLLTNLVGLAVYWIYQAQNAKSSPVCPACGKAMHKGHAYCPWCASPLTKECEGCGKAMERGWKACPWCGKPVE